MDSDSEQSNKLTEDQLTEATFPPSSEILQESLENASLQNMTIDERCQVILKSVNDTNNPDELFNALADETVENAARLLRELMESNDGDCQKVMFSNGNDLPMFFAEQLWGGRCDRRDRRDRREHYLNILKQFSLNSKLLTMKNSKEESILSLLFSRKSDPVALAYSKSKLISHLPRASSAGNETHCNQCPNESHETLLAVNEDPKGIVKSTDWRFTWILKEACDSQWLNMQVLVDALPPNEDMQPLLELLLDDNEYKTSEFQRMFKESAFDGLKSLFGKQQCVRCLKRTLMSSYWKRRFQDLKMPLRAIEAFDTIGLCTESYLIPRPSDDSGMSRPLAMIFYNEGVGKKIKAKEDAEALQRAFREGLGWPECSVKIQDEGFRWTRKELLGNISAKLLPSKQSGPVDGRRMGEAVNERMGNAERQLQPLNSTGNNSTASSFTEVTAGGSFNSAGDTTTDATNCSLFILSISGHGSAGMICAHRGPDLQIKDILDLVHELLPPYIPKVVIIDACQSKMQWPSSNPHVDLTNMSTLLLMASVRGQEGYTGRYMINLAKEIEIGNDSLQNMHCRATLRTLSHEYKKESPTQIAVLQSTTAKQIFLRNFDHKDCCNEKYCLKPNKKANYVICNNCTAWYHLECVPQEKDSREKLAHSDLATLEKRGVHWFCQECEKRLVRL